VVKVFGGATTILVVIPGKVKVTVLVLVNGIQPLPFLATTNGSLAVRTGYGAERACSRPTTVVVLMQSEHGIASP
jgi:hypothetical protein